MARVSIVASSGHRRGGEKPVALMVKWGVQCRMNASIAEAKKQFCEIVRRAESGQATVITNNSRPAARVVPVEKASVQLLRDWRKRREKIRLNPPGAKRTTVATLVTERRK
jgi:prevent-host-death family protein